MQNNSNDTAQKPTRGEFMGETVILSTRDGLPVRNRMPIGLACSLRTQAEWESLGFMPKEGEQGHELHPSMAIRRTQVYFHSSEVTDRFGDGPEDSEPYRRREAMERSLYAQCSGRRTSSRKPLHWDREPRGAYAGTRNWS